MPAHEFTGSASARHPLNTPRIGLLGMAPDTGNMGVSALCKSTVAAITQSVPDCDLVVFDNGNGVRSSSLRVGNAEIPVTLCGLRVGRRYYKRENLYTLDYAARLAALGRAHPTLRLIDSCTVMMDISAGDSFSDIYGRSRFDAVTLPKSISTYRARPLVLLPQTYGPFADDDIRRRARQAVLDSAVAWARDEDSFHVLKELLGSNFDPSRHRSGVDMAFGLPSREPEPRTLGTLNQWISESETLVGLNISGLIWNAGADKNNHFGFKADYQQLCRQAVEWILTETNAQVLLIPHVMAPSGTPESDADAAMELLTMLDQAAMRDDRIRVAPANLDEQELKWLIAHCGWFCGTRMHATIAALSSAVPTASIVYSDKAAGVFARCDQRSQIIDPRITGTDAALEQFIHCYQQRETAAASLRRALVSVEDALAEQINSFTRIVESHA